MAAGLIFDSLCFVNVGEFFVSIVEEKICLATLRCQRDRTDTISISTGKPWVLRALRGVRSVSGAD
jgi:hypothetical protein